MTTPPKKRVWPFLKFEMKGLFFSFFSPFWKLTLILGLLLSIFLASKIWIFPDPKATPLPFDLMSLLILIGLSLTYVLPLSILGGSIKGLWRLFGMTTLLPLLVIPLVTYFVLWMSGDLLRKEGLDILQALNLAYQSKGLPTLEWARVAHAGGPAALIILAVMIPFFLIDALALLTDPGVLWQAFQFLLWMGLVLFLSCLMSLLISTPPLLIVFIRRLKKRYYDFSNTGIPG